MKSICGIDCTNCELSGACSGCAATEGRPFGVECLVAQCCKRGEAALDALKKRLIAAFNALHIPDMEEVTELNALKGSFANILYALPNGQIVKFWESDRCYGIIADEKYLMVSEYSGFGADADIVVFKQWNDAEDK